MGNGKFVAIIGGIIGIVFVLLSLVGGEFLSWYQFGGEIDLGPYGSSSGGLYLTAFGNIISDPTGGPEYEIATLVLLGGIMVLAGAGLCIVGGATEKKPLGIIGGILMILGPMMIIFDLVGEVSEFSQFINDLSVAADSNVFFGSYSYDFYYIYYFDFTWSLTIGFFITIGGGVVGLIGGALI